MVELFKKCKHIFISILKPHIKSLYCHRKIVENVDFW